MSQKVSAFKIVGQKLKAKDARHVSIGTSADDLKHRSWKYLYRLPPVGNIALEQFELIAFERLTLLRLIDNWRARGTKYPDMKVFVNKESERIYGAEPESAEKDWISHHILRLAFSQNESLRRWFLQQECTLFEVRLDKLTAQEYMSIVAQNGIKVENVDAEEMKQVRPQLDALCFALKEKNDNATVWFKVPFTDVISLVGKRRVFISKGFAYISAQQLTSLISQQFKTKLNDSLTRINLVWPVLEDKESDRLLPFLKTLATKSFSSINDKNMKIMSGNKVQPEQIETLAKESFPLCMKILHRKLKDNHHLKHNGRQQFGLFLKGIGLTLEDALRYWRDEFSKSMPADKFEKNYAYNIRHNYGKEGKRTNYSPYSCNTIITGLSHPGVGEYHGCPFKTFDADNLKTAIRVESNGAISANDAEGIIDLCKKQHYQIACKKFFELTHPKVPLMPSKQNADGSNNADMPFQHPNLYYRNSRYALGAPDDAPQKQAAEGKENAAEENKAAASSASAPKPCDDCEMQE